MAQNETISPQKDVKKFLNHTKSMHDNHDFDDFVSYLKKGVNMADVGRLFGNVTRQTAWIWRACLQRQYPDIYAEISAAAK